MTTPILRRFGFRPVLVVNGLLNAVTIAACAAIDRAMPMLLVCTILFAGGMTRSMQFTAQNTIAFADIPRGAMSAANTLFSAAFQLAMGLGVGSAPSRGGSAASSRSRIRRPLLRSVSHSCLSRR